MPQNWIPILAGALLLGVLAFALLYQKQHPRQILGSGTVLVTSKTGGATVTLNTRDVAINSVVFQEVELPNGTWIGCEGDCALAAREAGPEFWDKQAREKR